MYRVTGFQCLQKMYIRVNIHRLFPLALNADGRE